VEVNGHRVDIPAYRVVPGEEVRVAPGSRELVAVKLAQEAASRGQPVAWLSVDADKVAGRMTERPTREAIPINAQEQLIVELYSK
jgi:small subunit ribosomal protein S4